MYIKKLFLILLLMVSISTNVMSFSYTQKVKSIKKIGVIELKNGEVVTLIGLKPFSPEIEKLISAERDQLFQDLTLNRKIRMEKDVFFGDREHKNNKGYTLAYVSSSIKRVPKSLLKYNPQGKTSWWKEKWMNLNALMISLGMMRVSKKPDFKYAHQYLKLEKQAKEERRGGWKYFN